MKKLGKLIWRLYLAFMAVLLLGGAMSFLGTPWGYLDFYIRASQHLEQYFGGDAKVTGVSYDFKLKSYLGSAKHKDIPSDTFSVRKVHLNGGTEIRNYYHLLLWETELMARYQPAYPEFTLRFDLPVAGSPYVSPRAPEDFPSIFSLESPGDFLRTVSITIPAEASNERLFALVTELDATFPQTDINVWQEEEFFFLNWRDREPREDFNAFLDRLTEKHSY